MAKNRSMISLLLVLLLTFALCAGCAAPASETTTPPAATATPAASTAASSEPAASSEAPADATPPPAEGDPALINPMPIVDTPTKLTYWVNLGGDEAKQMQNMGEMRCFQEMAKVSNIDMQFLHPPTGSTAEALTLMLSSGDIPDIIRSWVNSYPGGAMKGVTDGVYLPITDYVDQYAPYYQRLRKGNPVVEKESMMDDGTIIGFTQIQPDLQSPWFGMMLRKDFLDNAGLGVPETIEQWYTALKAFKDAGVEFPFNWDPVGETWGGFFINAYGIGHDMFVENGHIAYAFTRPEYKEYLEEMRKWYAEGLIDPEYKTRDSASRDDIIINGKCGAFANWNWQVYNEAIVEPGIGDIVAAPYPTIPGREAAKFRQQDYMTGVNPYVVVTTSCKTPELAIRWLDYWYSEQGFMWMNWGVEGESYTLEDGPVSDMQFQNPETWAPYIPNLYNSGKHPVNTDEILNNPDGYDYYLAIAKYKPHTGPYLRSDRSGEREAPFFAFARYDLWGRGPIDQNLPPVSFTTEEDERRATLRTDVDTYWTEAAFGFITGTKSMDEFDAYVNDLKSVGCEELTQLYETAYQRFLNR